MYEVIRFKNYKEYRVFLSKSYFVAKMYEYLYRIVNRTIDTKTFETNNEYIQYDE